MKLPRMGPITAFAWLMVAVTVSTTSAGDVEWKEERGNQQRNDAVAIGVLRAYAEARVHNLSLGEDCRQVSMGGSGKAVSA